MNCAAWTLMWVLCGNVLLPIHDHPWGCWVPGSLLVLSSWAAANWNMASPPHVLISRVFWSLHISPDACSDPSRINCSSSFGPSFSCSAGLERSRGWGRWALFPVIIMRETVSLGQFPHIGCLLLTAIMLEDYSRVSVQLACHMICILPLT